MKFSIILALFKLGRCVSGTPESNINNLIQEGNKYASKIRDLWTTNNFMGSNLSKNTHHEINKS